MYILSIVCFVRCPRKAALNGPIKLNKCYRAVLFFGTVYYAKFKVVPTFDPEFVGGILKCDHLQVS